MKFAKNQKGDQRGIPMDYRKSLIALACIAAMPVLGHAVTLGQVDTFSDGTTLNWQGASPTNIASGGPSGAGDAFLQLTSSGSFGAGSKMASPNAIQWSGDYATTGIRLVECDMKNSGSTQLSMRIVLTSAGFSKYTSTIPVVLPPGGGWKRVQFSLQPTDLSLIVGAEAWTTVMPAVAQIQFRHNTTLFDGGEPIAAQLGIDNITASAGRTVSGKITFSGTSLTTGNIPAKVTFRAPGSGTVIYSVTAQVNASTNSFTVTAPPIPGPYDMSIQGSHWLRKVVSINTTSADATGVNVALINGDCDGGNFINTDDYLVLSGAFDTIQGDALYVAGADLDDNGIVNTDDYLILNENFDLTGDE